MDVCRELHCTCGRVHRCDIKHVEIGSGALSALRKTTADYSHILLVADEHTFAVCGEAVEELLADRCVHTLIYHRDGLLVPDETAIAELRRELSTETDLMIGIGSGVIQDLCKYVSFEAGLPYQIVATAPSMDGYASKGAAMIIGNMKITYNAHTPEAIIGDLDILKDAPMEMIQAGYGDILGKFSCLNDWKLSAAVRGEYFCQTIYDMVYDMLLRVKDLGPRLLARDGEAVGILMEAIVGVGIAMAYIGNSRPASGSEHHLSHFFEVTGLLNDEFYFMHGTDVAYSAVYTQKLREELLSLDQPMARGGHTMDHWAQAIRAVYGAAAEGVIRLQTRQGWYEQNRLPVYAEKWEEIKSVLQEVPSSAELTEYLRSVGLDILEFERAYTPEKLQNAIWYAKDLKDRYSVLWMYYDLMR